MSKRSYQIPGGPRVTETGSFSYQIPGGPRITETATFVAEETSIPRNIHIKVMTFEFMIPEVVGEEPPVGQKTIYNFLIMI